MAADVMNKAVATKPVKEGDAVAYNPGGLPYTKPLISYEEYDDVPSGIVNNLSGRFKNEGYYYNEH